MHIIKMLLVSTLSYGMNASLAAHQEAIPADYPNHESTIDCTKLTDISTLQAKLHNYNLTRVQVNEVLYDMVDSYDLDAGVKDDLRGFAEGFERMGQELPQPDPGTDNFRNFDFKLGLTLTAVTVYLNTKNDSLTKRFQSDRDNPKSKLGIYLAKLDSSRDDYLAELNNHNKGTCS